MMGNFNKFNKIRSRYKGRRRTAKTFLPPPPNVSAVLPASYPICTQQFLVFERSINEFSHERDLNINICSFLYE